ncbi:unnamed protein product [Somion occarium]|uniref:Uncharacterized protein n=1 Tax=Somion occarium TaxID=3059160 RepID=A0ABP1D6Z4_9APHY
MSLVDLLPPDVVANMQTAGYMAVAVVAAWTWDYFISTSDEVWMFTEHKFALPDVAYVFARFTSGGFLAASLAFLSAGDDDTCRAIGKVICWFGAFALPCNFVLFFLRVKAVFRRSPILVGIFAILWLSTLGSFTLPFSTTGERLLGSHNCVTTNVTPISSVGFLTVAIFDAIVFVMISIRLVSYSMADSWKERIFSFFSGQNMGFLSKAVLKTGQLYYLATVGVNIFVLFTLVTSSFPPALRAVLTMPTVALQNAMACRVYRLLKLGFIEEDPSILRTSLAQAYGGSRSLHYATGHTLPTGDDDGWDQDGRLTSIGMVNLSSNRSQRKMRPSQSPMQISINEEIEVSIEDAYVSTLRTSSKSEDV